MKLEDKPHLAIPKGRQGFVIHGEDIRAFPQNLSGAGALQGAQDMEQGGFAHPRGPHHRQGFPREDIQVHPGEHLHLDAVSFKGLDQSPDANLRRGLRAVALCHSFLYRAKHLTTFAGVRQCREF